MTSLEARFDAVQDQILSLYEKGSSVIDDQILYWALVRKEGALEYWARRQGLSRLGLHTVPSQAGAESKAKSAILMHLQLSSLKKSQYGGEPWTMPETSIEMYARTSPAGTFKKNGVEAEVYYDCDEENAVSYMVWGSIYKQDEEGQWHRYTSDVDYYGVYYTDQHGVSVYYEDFDKDAERYGSSKQWTVNFKSNTFTSCPDSSTKETPDTDKRKRRHDPRSEHSQKAVRRRSRTPSPPAVQHPDSSTCHTQAKRRRLGQGERGSLDAVGQQAGRCVEEAGGGHQGLGRDCGGRLAGLLADSGDSPIILVKGPANSLKCWRNRVRRRFPRPFLQISTVFSWVDERDSVTCSLAQLLVAFTDSAQRNTFLRTVSIPRGTLVFRGSLDGL